MFDVVCPLTFTQRDFAAATCATCGMMYGKGLPEEERLHAQFHNASASTLRFTASTASNISSCLPLRNTSTAPYFHRRVVPRPVQLLRMHLLSVPHLHHDSYLSACGFHRSFNSVACRNANHRAGFRTECCCPTTYWAAACCASCPKTPKRRYGR